MFLEDGGDRIKTFRGTLYQIWEFLSCSSTDISVRRYKRFIKWRYVVEPFNYKRRTYN